MKTIGAVTVARSDYGIYLPIFRRLQREPELRLQIYVTGMHLAPEFGCTVTDIERDGFEIADRIHMLLSSDTAEATAMSIGIGTLGLAKTFARCRPDVLLVLGDRFEMLAAAAAALPQRIPVAHIHGGEISEGAFDDATRHAITKMSHLHFVATQTSARRVMQMGEQPWRVVVSGAPGLDNLHSLQLLDAVELQRRCGVDVNRPFLLVTYHPETLTGTDTTAQVQELLAALRESELHLLLTYPNADPNGRLVLAKLKEFVASQPNAVLVPHLGTEAYFSIMARAAAMVGNSSSGIVEAASFKLPVVNVGQRQAGRERAENVLDVACERTAILAAVRRAVTPAFRANLAALRNPYGTGCAADTIVDVLRKTEFDDSLLIKRFYDQWHDKREVTS
jgi:UDP-hydrolysing UDP-N-acetyl-D-glucosamine 2-epimerase